MRRISSVLTLRGRSLVSAGLALVAAGTALGFLDLTRIGILVIALPVIAALRAQRHPLRLVVDRRVTPHRVQLDEPAQVRLSVENRDRRTSPLLLAEEGLPAHLGDRPRLILPRMGPGERREVGYRIRTRLRGRHELGPLTVRIKDPFDLAMRTAVQSGTSDLIVLPHIHPLPSSPPLSSGAGGEGAVPQHVALHGEDDIAIREYRHGDDLRRIHWPSTARTGEVMMRQEERPAQRQSVVIVDTRAAAHGITTPGQTSESLEWAVSAAASIVTHLGRQDFSLHLLTARTAADHAVHSEMGVDDAVDVLAMVEAVPDTSLDQLVLAADALTTGGGVVIAVLGELDATGVQGLATLRRPGVQCLAMVLSGQAWGAGRSVRGAEHTTTARVLAEHGWRVSAVGPQTSVPQAWADVQHPRAMVLR